MTYTHILFDFDGTLCDTLPAFVDSVKATFDLHGLGRPSDPALYELFERGLVIEDAFEALCREHPDPGADPSVLADTYRQVNVVRGPAHTTIFPGVIEMLEALSAAGMVLGIVSNKWEVTLLDAVRRFGLDRYCDPVVGLGRTGLRKPDPAVVTRFFPSAAAVPGRQVLVVGDTRTDVAFAASFGAASCLVRHPSPRSVLPAPTFVVDDVTDVPGLLGVPVAPGEVAHG